MLFGPSTEDEGEVYEVPDSSAPACSRKPPTEPWASRDHISRTDAHSRKYCQYAVTVHLLVSLRLMSIQLHRDHPVVSTHNNSCGSSSTDSPSIDVCISSFDWQPQRSNSS